MAEDKEVDTLDNLNEDNKNTETNLENEVQDDLNNAPDIDSDTLNTLNDEQFSEFLQSGKLPEGFKVGGKEDSKNVDSSTDTRESVDDNNPDESSKPIPSSKSDERTDRTSDGLGGSRTSEKSRQTEGNNAQTEVHKQKTSEEDSTGKQSDIDYKASYDSIFKGFKANGKEIKPQTVEDVVQLMQMGANYTKKMQAMAPMRRTVESLNRANITENDLNLLIDIHKGDKEAIKKLLEKSKIDPMDLDMENLSYTPKDNMLSNEDVEYSSVLSDIQSSLPKIQEIVNKQWDSKSKELLLKDSRLMQALHEEIEMGRFDEVQARLEHEKTFGRYKDKSDVEAYIDLVNKMLAEKQTKNPTPDNQTKPNTPKRDIPDKKGAAPNKAVKAVTQSTSISAKDIFSMSEEEFAKLSIKNLI